MLKLRKSGVDEGWLSITSASMHSDTQNHIYRLVYKHPEGNLHICCRLDRAGKEISFSELNVGKLMLDSRSASQSSQSLASEHSLILLE